MAGEMKEHSRARARRLSLGIPHVYWNKNTGHWLVAAPTIPFDVNGLARDWVNDQDRRWTPRDKS